MTALALPRMMIRFVVTKTRNARGASRFELLAAVVVIAVFAAGLLNRFWFYQEVAEKAAVEYTISILKSALRLRMAELLTQGKTADLALLAKQNPMEWLDGGASAAEYRSKTAGLGKAKSLAGQWQFDANAGVLTYWPVRSDHLEADAQGYKRIRLAIKAIPSAGGGQMAGSQEAQASVVGIRLEVEPYRWFRDK